MEVFKAVLDALLVCINGSFVVVGGGDGVGCGEDSALKVVVVGWSEHHQRLPEIPRTNMVIVGYCLHDCLVCHHVEIKSENSSVLSEDGI